MDSDIDINKFKNDIIANYGNTGLCIVCFNDLLAVNSPKFPKKNFIDYLKRNLSDMDFSIDIINIFSDFLNSAEYINYLLENNLSIEELNLIQRYFLVEMLKNLDIVNFDNFLRYINNVSFNNKDSDNKKFLADIIKNSFCPVVIYSSGISKLKREYNYSIDPYLMVNSVINEIEVNFYNILSLNNKANIIFISAYCNSNDDKFNEIINIYNNAMIELCNKYGCTYIDINKLEGDSKKLADSILSSICINSVNNRDCLTQLMNGLFMSNSGIEGMFLVNNYDYMYQLGTTENEFDNNHSKVLEREYKMNCKVLKKALNKSTTVRVSKY